MMGTAIGSMFMAGVLVVRQWLVAPELRMAHRLMVLALISIFLRRIEAARAWLWEEIKQEGVNLTSLINLVVLSLLAPNHQKG
jgi:hypothetical protein